MTIGNYYSIWYDSNLVVPININIRSHCHLLLSGSSGSGKSISALYMLGKLLQENPNVVIYFVDFKCSEDFIFLKDYAHYYNGENCYQGIMDYYDAFTKSRENGETLPRHLLIIDEYQAYITYLSGLDKNNKTKYSNDILNAVSSILMLGRGIGNGFGIWVLVQRTDSNLFQAARDNFMITIVLGHLSKEQKQMAFSGEEVPAGRIYKVGEGLAYIDGIGLVEIKYPRIRDIVSWKKHILTILLSNPSVAFSHVNPPSVDSIEECLSVALSKSGGNS